MSLKRRTRAPLVAVVACAALTGGLLQAAPAVAAPNPHPSTRPATPPAPSGQVKDPGKKLGKGWKTSPDRAVTAAADANGLRILVADSGKAYTWRTAAVLSEPGMPADSWIGNQCLMDHDHAAVVYAPRSFTNKPDLMQGGAFTAIVDLTTGHVKKLPFNGSLAYFDPSCNTTTHTAAFTAFRDMNDPTATRTRVITVGVDGRTSGTAAAKGEITSAVPVKDGTVAALGSRLVHLDRSGKVKNLADADGAPFDIRPAADGTIGFVVRKGDSAAHAKLFTGSGKPKTLASAKLGDLDLVQGEAGRVFLTGHPKGSPATAGTGVTRLNAPAGTDVSSHGRLAIEPVLTPGVHAGLAHIKGAGKGFTKSGEPASQTATPADDGDKPVTVTSIATTTGTKLTQSVQQAAGDGSGNNPSPVLPKAAGTHRSKGSSSKAGLTVSPPTDDDRWCAVSRNDVKVQALQPTSNQVEWAVDMAVRGNLRSNYIRQGGYRSQAGLGTIDPQGLFPPPTLTGDAKARIPANVLLGIMAQESNLWQAEGGSVPGQMGNPLAAVDGYYGHKADPNDPAAYWQINWDKSDCGYGVGQVTDGMRLAGHEKVDANGNKEKLLDPALQKLVAVDYASNIAASMKILADKWNEVHKAGQKITVNNDDPSKVENWFTAVWNYNLGFNPPSEASKHDGHWGLGWYNNPANPIYAKGWGHPFMNTDVDPYAVKDAAHPQDWPYELKVMGWAAWSIDTGFSYATSGRQDWPGESGFSSAGFRPAYWNGTDQPYLYEGSARYNRVHVAPPLDAFCNSKNNCNPNTPPDCPDAACYAKYWWNQPNVTWKDDCASTCGFENIKYQTLVSEPGRGTRLQNGTPVCSGAPAGSKVVASLPNGTPTWSDQSGCATISSAGSFQFSFNPGTEGRYQAKADLHSVGGGYGGHYWWTHTRDADHFGGDNGYMTIKGTWTLGQSLNWARVLVHLPDTGAQTRQARYNVLGSDSLHSQRVVLQRAGGWVSLGAFHFTGTPKVELSNTTKVGTADEDIAWDAVAFQPLSGKPANSVVAMGDSYSSGEGATGENGKDLYEETDHNDKQNKNAIDKCHRSKLAWSRQATLPGYSSSIGAMADSLDPQMDYHFVACSGARTFDMLKDGQSGEVAQLDTGYLDQNTTLVTLSIGGNDARFSDIMKKCVDLADPQLSTCPSTELDNLDPATGDTKPGTTGDLKDWAPKWLHDAVRPQIVKTLNAIHGLAPKAKVVLMGYPRLIEKDHSCLPGAYETVENDWVRSLADNLATEMKGATQDAGSWVVFSDPRDRFDGKAACGSPETINAIVENGREKADEEFPNASMQSFHPKIAGARLYADNLEQTLRGM
ncbi:GDSL-type esterase/lipase family protein [Streptomyces sp. HD]|uniref:GDSL-type esterase/lipase family protein n=1 Tax=Streptomyces sp. HD TaxID=3020892 RepID=UPI00232F247D|nr:GDSL-type esterase/lipase family protein [Streptomyces sp. HD]MDC0773043.1 GDSL-type esterase/lipase family protein [Streptomyces sp. HD]